MSERLCPLTEKICNLPDCKKNCYGNEAAKALAQLKPCGNIVFVARAYNSVVGHLPVKLQKIIINRAARQHTLDQVYKPKKENLFGKGNEGQLDIE